MEKLLVLISGNENPDSADYGIDVQPMVGQWSRAAGKRMLIVKVQYRYKDILEPESIFAVCDLFHFAEWNTRILIFSLLVSFK
jgi:hypothetical protein